MRRTTSFLSVVRTIFKIADAVILQALKWISIICLVLLFVLVMAGFIVRIGELGSIHFFDEILAWLLAGMIFYGAAGLWIRRDHFRLDVLKKILSDRCPVAYAIFNLFIELASLFFIGLFTYECYDLIGKLMGETNDFRIPEKYIYLTALFIPGVVMIVYSFRNIAVCVRSLARLRRTNAGPDSPADWALLFCGYFKKTTKGTKNTKEDKEEREGKREKL
jgi:TRAP-type C4-dicarboxylate transport system permease small subunit